MGPDDTNIALAFFIGSIVGTLICALAMAFTGARSGHDRKIIDDYIRGVADKEKVLHMEKEKRKVILKILENVK